MINKLLDYDVTYVSFSYFEERSYEIIFEVYNDLLSSEELLVKEFISALGSEELYESLNYHNDLIKSVFSIKKYELLDEFFIWKYSVYKSRGVDLDYFLIEYDLWKHSISKYLYQAHSHEINIVYDYLIQNHETYKNKAMNIKEAIVKEKYKNIFDELKKYLMEGKKEKFHELIDKNLKEFDNDIFKLIEELITPLMHDIGYMWQYNEISVAKEHLATSLTHEIIDRFFLVNDKKIPNKELALISTIGDETHNLGVKIVGEFLLSKEFDVKNLGSKISNKELISSVFELKPKILVLSVTLTSNLDRLQKIVSELKSDINMFNGIIIVGGQALFKADKKVTIDGVDLIAKDLKELDNFLKFIL